MSPLRARVRWTLTRGSALIVLFLAFATVFTALTDFYLMWRIGWGYSVRLEKAGLIGEYTPWQADAPVLVHVGIVHGSCSWWFGFDHTRGHVGVLIPLWAPLLVVTVLAGPSWIAEYRSARIKRRGAVICSRCRYDRRGLEPGVACPECGSPAPNPAHPEPTPRILPGPMNSRKDVR